MGLALDAALDQRTWGKADRATLKDIVLEAVGELLEGGTVDDTLKALFEKHAGLDFERPVALSVAARRVARPRRGLSALNAWTVAVLLRVGMDGRSRRARPKQRDLVRRHAAVLAAPGGRRPTRHGVGGRITQARGLAPDRETDLAERDAGGADATGQPGLEANTGPRWRELQPEMRTIWRHVADRGEERLMYYDKYLGEQPSG